MKRSSCALLAVLALLATSLPKPSHADPSDVSRQMILDDPAAPTGGKREGDVTIVAYLDYNCGFCKKAAGPLERLVKTDRNIRLVYKDWPILGESSVYGAKLALAAKHQGKYEVAHRALMALKGAKIPTAKMDQAVKAAGVDMARLMADAKTHEAEIVAFLKRNDAQARGMQFAGTPVYLVGPLKVAAALSYEDFRDAVAQARARRAKTAL